MANNKNRTRNSSGKSSGATRNRSGGSNTKRNTRKNTAPKNTLAGDIALVVCFGLTILMYLADFKLCGRVGQWLCTFTFGLFGWLGYLSPILFLIAVCVLVSSSIKMRLRVGGKIILWAFLFVITCAFFGLFTVNNFQSLPDYKVMYEYSLTGKGGGLFGNALVLLLVPKFGMAASFIILLILWIVDFLVVTDFSLIDWIEYRVTLYKESAPQVKEIKEIKQEELQHKRAEKLERNRLRNEERMMKAMENLKKSYEDSAKKTDEETKNRVSSEERKSIRPVVKSTEAGKKSPVVEMPKREVNNPVIDDIDLPPVKPAVKNNREKERRRIPSFLLNDDEFNKKNKLEEKHESDFEHIVPVENETPKEEPNKLGFIHESELTGIHQMRINELDKKPENVIHKSDIPVRKPFEPVVAEEDRVIELAGGRIINARTGMGGTTAVEAEGMEKDPHGTGHEYTDDEDEKPVVTEVKKQVPEKKYKFPPLSLLTKNNNIAKNNRAELKETADRLQTILENFGVGATVTDVTCGPSVTRYELTPDMGVKVSRIVGLQDDIKLNLAATDIRIEAPIPGKSAIGIEVPNKEKVSVTLREMLESDEFKNHKSKLAFTAGKDISGANIIGDIAKMPHLLIAGATGSGKSVCVNTIIVSLLYHSTPSEVKLLMIDPKVVELKIYNGIPHLLRPVITDPKQATGALNWAVTEMNRRYKLFADSNVRDLAGYNEALREEAEKLGEENPKTLPQIVIIVDELADLMMSAPNEVEDSIMHLAQMARAAGMHLILITQRPSVNVVTGTIKANIPSRIALSVASGVDSRTMIDTVGAEKLLGNGDMLYFPTGMTKPVRLQGPFVSDKEINLIVDYLKNQTNVAGGGYDDTIDITPVASAAEKKSASSSKDEDDDTDNLLRDAGEYIITSDKASIGMLQRKFRIGFNRAARIMDQLSEMGVVGPEDGTKPRNITMSLEEFNSKF